ncbi:ribonuclease H-like domain-containing protein, partial [Tanacetum coccineum]
DSVYKSKVSETITSVPNVETTITRTSKDCLEKPKTVRFSAHIIKDWESDSEDENVFEPKEVKKTIKSSFENINFVNARNSTIEKPRKFSQNPRDKKRNRNSFEGTGQREVRQVWNNAMRVNHQNYSNFRWDFAPTAILTKSGIVPISAARQSSLRAAAPASAARPINTALPKPFVNVARPRPNAFHKSHSPSRIPFNQQTSLKNRNLNDKVNTAKVNFVNTAKGNKVTSAIGEQGINAGNPQYALQDQGIFDSGCSRHMTGNKFYLSDYQDIDGGFVAFGGSSKGGKITGKGKIRTGKLDFEDVYFVKELKFNLFSVSQMCDKKNSVLFTETECLVLSPDFKLLDESQVLLKIPRQNNMYSFDLKNVVPSGGLTCLFAKATIDESNLWHRRLGHINFKTMNKLVRGNLVRGLPSKLFENDHTCVACQKGKQHKASYPLGKFDGKADEGFLVGYSINSKDFRVFKTRTRKVEENLHITFIENKPNVARSGPDWLFDIDLLTNSMNYEPVTAGNQTNSLEDAVVDDAGKKTTEESANEGERNAQEKEGRASKKEGDQNVQDLIAELDKLLVQQEEAYYNITNRVSTVSPYVNAVGQSFINANDLPTNPLMPDLEDTTDLLNTGIFNGAYDDEDVGAEANLKNLETTMMSILFPQPGFTRIILKSKS